MGHEREMHVVRRVGHGPVHRDAPGSGSSMAGDAAPSLWLGAPATGGLVLPAANPTAAQLYAPRGVWLDDEQLVVADTGNHRVLIWCDPASLTDHRPADVVLGQPDFESEGAQASGRGPEHGMRLPTGVLIDRGRLVVADAWNHRILVWDTVPRESGARPDVVLGQSDAVSVEENRGAACGPDGFYWPFGIAVVDGTFYVADTGNRRVLAWTGIPEPGRDPELILGQPSAEAREENRGRLGGDSFRWPHAIAGDDSQVLIADAGNHRVLTWEPRPERDRPADRVLGQPDFESASEFPYAPQSAQILRFPYAVAVDDGLLAAADTANNRVLIWDRLPQGSTGAADRVLGQPDFTTNGENRWDAVGPDTLCWPYGICLHRGRLAVADSGNNRVMVWTLGR